MEVSIALPFARQIKSWKSAGTAATAQHYRVLPLSQGERSFIIARVTFPNEGHTILPHLFNLDGLTPNPNFHHIILIES